MTSLLMKNLQKFSECGMDNSYKINNCSISSRIHQPQNIGRQYESHSNSPHHHHSGHNYGDYSFIYLLPAGS